MFLIKGYNFSHILEILNKLFEIAEILTFFDCANRVKD